MFKEFTDFLVNIEPTYDKMSHLYYGTILSMFFILIRNNFGIIPILLISIIKEIVDYFTKGEIEILDVIYSVIPSIIFTLLLINNKLKKEF